jgi:hypothetical protein
LQIVRKFDFVNTPARLRGRSSSMSFAASTEVRWLDDTAFLGAAFAGLPQLAFELLPAGFEAA